MRARQLQQSPARFILQICEHDVVKADIPQYEAAVVRPLQQQIYLLRYLAELRHMLLLLLETHRGAGPLDLFRVQVAQLLGERFADALKADV
jgi:hypothetical protein